MKAGGEDARHDVAADVGADRRQGIKEPPLVDADAGLGGSNRRNPGGRRNIRRAADAAGIEAQQKMDHRRVARANHRRDATEFNRLADGQGLDEVVHVAHDAPLHLPERIVLLGIDDAPNVVLAEMHLRVVGGFGVQSGGAGQVHQVGDDRRGADIHDDGVIAPAGVAGLDIDHLEDTAALRQCRRHLVFAFLEDIREAKKDAIPRLHERRIDALPNRHVEPLVVGRLVFVTRLRHFQVMLLNQRIIGESAFAEGLAGQFAEPMGVAIDEDAAGVEEVALRDGDRCVRKDPNLAGQDHPLADLLRRKQCVRRGLDLALIDDDLAFAAVTVAPADACQIHSGQPRRLQERRAARHFGLEA